MSNEIHQVLIRKYKRNKTVTTILHTNGCLELKKKARNEFFMHLSRTVVGQQLSKSATTAIWARIESFAIENNSNIFNLFSDKNYTALKNCGLSRFKIKAISGLRKAIEKKTISEEIFNTDKQEIIITEISKLWGLGQWSAEMSALFFFAIPDVWSAQDAALKRAIMKISKIENITEDSLIKTASPYRSYLALHFWKALDTRVI